MAASEYLNSYQEPLPSIRPSLRNSGRAGPCQELVCRDPGTLRNNTMFLSQGEAAFSAPHPLPVPFGAARFCPCRSWSCSCPSDRSRCRRAASRTTSWTPFWHNARAYPRVCRQDCQMTPNKMCDKPKTINHPEMVDLPMPPKRKK